MKLTAFILFIACLQVSANGLAQVTFSGKDVPIEKVFEAIKKQTGYSFLYNSDEIKKAKPVTINVKDMALEEVLAECLKGQPFEFNIKHRTIFILPRKNNTEPSTTILPPTTDIELIDVIGRVVNEKGEAVNGVTVTIKGTTTSTLTNNNGEFSLTSIDPNGVLVFTHVSMESFEISVSGRSELLISLKTKVSSLGEVTISVNTGYQQISKERFVGSVSTLDSAAFHRRVGMDIISRLDGTVTGMLFDKKSGRATLNSIQIRGISTLGGNNSPNNAPLIVVDNFPFREDINLINPNDIESINVLKDAAAASVWGAQAGNGVIVITTKKGNYNQPLKVSLGYNVTIQNKPDLYYFPQIGISDFIDAETFLFNNGKYDSDLGNTNSWPVISPTIELLAKRRAGLITAEDSALQINSLKSMDLRRDLDKHVYRRAVLQQYYTNLKGGSRLLNYNLSIGYNRDLNNINKSRPNDQITIKSNAGFKPWKDLEVTAGINYTQSTQRSTDFALPGKIYPYAQLVDAQGNALAVPYGRRTAYVDTAGAGGLLDWRYRPLDEISLANRKEEVRFVQLSTSLSYRIAAWLTALASFQFINQSGGSRNIKGVETYFSRNLINQYTNLAQLNPALRHPIPIGDILETAEMNSTTQNVRGQLNFNKGFGGKHNVSAIVAAELFENKNSGVRSRTYGYDNATGAYNSALDYVTDFPQYGNTVQGERIPNDNVILPSKTSRIVSFLGNMSYTYNSRYVVYASARKDGSNAFGVNTNRKWNPLWSAGLSWDISKEAFFHETWISILRLRGSYGFTGNVGRATGLPTIQYSPSAATYTNLTSATINDPPNPDLRWEKVNIINVALDFSLFKSRIIGNIEGFHKKSTDVISSIGLAPSTGVTDLTVNYSNLSGSGFELNINSQNLMGALKWQTNFGLSYAKMKVTKLYHQFTRAQDFVVYGLNASEGRIAYGIASYRWNGLDPMTGDPRGFFNKQTTTNYLAVFNDSVDNQIFHGSAIPLYQGFIGNSFSYKNFVLSANITYRLGFYFRKPSINYSRLIDNWTGHADYALRWQKPGDEKFTNVPSFVYPADANRDLFYTYSEVNVLRGDNIRLQDIRLQYNCGNAFLTRLPNSNLQVFVYVNNLNVILWRKNKSTLDPDFVGGSNFVGPTPKSWTLGFNLNL